MHQYTARATREEGWWTVTVDEAPNLFTQARRLDQIPDLVKEAAQLLDGISPDDLEVTVIPEGSYAHLSEEVKRSRHAATQAQNLASSQLLTAIRQFRSDGLSSRDVGALLDVSHQYVSKVARQA